MIAHGSVFFLFLCLFVALPFGHDAPVARRSRGRRAGGGHFHSGKVNGRIWMGLERQRVRMDQKGPVTMVDMGGPKCCKGTLAHGTTATHSDV